MQFLSQNSEPFRIDHILFIHSSVKTLVSWFSVLTLVRLAAPIVEVQILAYVLTSSHMYKHEYTYMHAGRTAYKLQLYLFGIFFGGGVGGSFHSLKFFSILSIYLPLSLGSIHFEAMPGFWARSAIFVTAENVFLLREYRLPCGCGHFSKAWHESRVCILKE